MMPNQTNTQGMMNMNNPYQAQQQMYGRPLVGSGGMPPRTAMMNMYPPQHQQQYPPPQQQQQQQQQQQYQPSQQQAGLGNNNMMQMPPRGGPYPVNPAMNRPPGGGMMMPQQVPPQQNMPPRPNNNMAMNGGYPVAGNMMMNQAPRQSLPGFTTPTGAGPNGSSGFNFAPRPNPQLQQQQAGNPRPMYNNMSGMEGNVPRPGYQNPPNNNNNFNNINPSGPSGLQQGAGVPANNANRNVVQQRTVPHSNQVMYASSPMPAAANKPSSAMMTPNNNFASSVPSTPNSQYSNNIVMHQPNRNFQDFTTPMNNMSIEVGSRPSSGNFSNANSGFSTPIPSTNSNNSLSELTTEQKGYLLKRKDFLGKDEHADSHPNRTYYFKRPLGDIDEVIDTCSKKLQSDPNNLQVLYLRGSSYFKKGMLDWCIRDLSLALQIQPLHIECLYIRGLAYFKTTKLEMAIKDLSLVLDQNPFHVNAAYSRAACYNKMGLLTQAIEDYNAALSKDSGNPLNPTSSNTSIVINDYQSTTVDDEYLDVDNSVSSTPRSRSNSGATMSLNQYLNSSSSSVTNSPPRLNSSGLQTPKSVSSGDKIFSLYEDNGGNNSRSSTPTSIRRPTSVDNNSRSTTPTSLSSSANNKGNGFTFKARGALKVNPNAPVASSNPNSLGSANNTNTLGAFTPQASPSTRNMPPPAALSLPRNLANGGAATPTSSASTSPPPFVQQSHPEADKYHSMAYEARRNGDFQTAIKHYTTALTILPTHFKALFNRAYAYDKVGERTKAIQDYTTALTLDGNNAFIYYNRGIAYDHASDLANAHRDFSQAILMQEKTNAAAAAAAAAAGGATNTGTNQQNNNSLLDFYQNRAFCSKKMFQYNPAIQDYSKILALIVEYNNHGDGSAYGMYKLKALFNRSQCYEKQSQHPEAIEDLNAAIECAYQTTSSGQYSVMNLFQSRAHVYEVMTQYHLAIQDYGHAIQEYHATTSAATSNTNNNVSTIYTLYLNRAKGYAQLSQPLKALEDYQALITYIQDRKLTSLLAQDQLIVLYYQRGMMFKILQRLVDAVQDFLAVIDAYYGGVGNISFVHKPCEEVTIMMLYTQLAYCYRKLEQYDDALYIFSVIIELLQTPAASTPRASSKPSESKESQQKEMIKALNNRAFIYAKVQNYQEAVEDYTRVLSMDPLNSHAYHNRGISFDKMGLIDQAISDFSKVFELDAKASSLSIQAADPAVAMMKNNLSAGSAAAANGNDPNQGNSTIHGGNKTLARLNSGYGYEFVEQPDGATNSDVAASTVPQSAQESKPTTTIVTAVPTSTDASTNSLPQTSSFISAKSKPLGLVINETPAPSNVEAPKISDWKKLGFASEYAYAKHLGLLDNKPKPLPSNVQNLIQNLSSTSISAKTNPDVEPISQPTATGNNPSKVTIATKSVSFVDIESSKSIKPTPMTETKSNPNVAEVSADASESSKPERGGLIKIPSFKDRPKVSDRWQNKSSTDVNASESNSSNVASEEEGVKSGLIKIPSFKDRPKVADRWQNKSATNLNSSESNVIVLNGEEDENDDNIGNPFLRKGVVRSLPPHPSMLKKVGSVKKDDDEEETPPPPPIVTIKPGLNTSQQMRAMFEKKDYSTVAADKPTEDESENKSKGLFRAPKMKVLFTEDAAEAGNGEDQSKPPAKISIGAPSDAGKVSAMAARFGANRLLNAPVASNASPLRSTQAATSANNHTETHPSVQEKDHKDHPKVEIKPKAPVGVQAFLAGLKDDQKNDSKSLNPLMGRFH